MRLMINPARYSISWMTSNKAGFFDRGYVEHDWVDNYTAIRCTL